MARLERLNTGKVRIDENTEIRLKRNLIGDGWHGKKFLIRHLQSLDIPAFVGDATPDEVAEALAQLRANGTHRRNLE
ncbi:hypothetical protein M1116_00260 [Patescibacteria group bacterium]|nr:hypothetical protein [Patescibacteria group bacterium]